MKKTVPVLLWETIEGLGDAGQVVTVRCGYARNHLFPKRLASPVGEGYRKMLERERRKRERLEARRIAEAAERAKAFAGVSLTIEAQTSEEGRLFGSVTPTMIAEALRDKGLIVEPRAVEIAEPIKQVGQYEVEIVLHRQVRPKVKVWVVSANLLPQEPGAGAPAPSEG